MDEFVEASYARVIILACVTATVIANLMIVWVVYPPKSRQADMNYGALKVGQILLADWSKDSLGNSLLIVDEGLLKLDSGATNMFGWTWQARVETDSLQYTRGYSGLLPRKKGSAVLPIIVRCNDGQVEGGKLKVWVW